MERIRNFLRDNGFALALAVCVLAAAATGLWAVRTIRAELDRQLHGSTRQQTTQPARQEPTAEQETEGITWQQQTEPAAGAAKDIPKPTPAPAPRSAGSAPSSSAGASSGSGSVSEPLVLQAESASGADAVGSACAPPVPGQILAAYSGDELVFNKTMGDWRTHNGTDYACAEGDAVTAPTAGTVRTVGTDANWGAVIELEDAEGRCWRLCGVASPKVKEGETVEAGAKLGKAAAVACESALGTHIHMEVKSGESWLDPAEVLN